MTVWTKQHKNVLSDLSFTGRYLALRTYIERDLGEHAALVLEVYDWYVRKAAERHPKPDDAGYPIWVSYSLEATMAPSEHTVTLELSLDDSIIMPVNIGKWGAILNYAYIPANPEDERRHKHLLEESATTDAQAYLSRFHPQIKREIVASWDRLFDDTIILDNRMAYGTLWELRREWLVRVVDAPPS